MAGFLRLLAAFALAAGLSGCFISDKPLITPADAAFPYQTITYAEFDGGKTQTITKSADGYLLKADDSDETATFLFKDIGDGLYVAQMEFKEDDKTRRLFAVLKVDVATKVAETFFSIAPKDGVQAPGLTNCSSDTVCIESLDAYVDYARKEIAAGHPPDSKFKLISME